MKRFTIYFLMLLATALSFASWAYAEELTISVDSVTIESGAEYVELPVYVSGNNQGIAGMVLSVSYDDELVLSGITKGEALSSLMFTPPGKYTNHCKLLWDGINGDTSNGEIFVLKFCVPENRGTYAVNVSYKNGGIFDANLDTLSPVIVNGKITVESVGSGEIIPEKPDEGETIVPEDEVFSIVVDSTKTEIGASSIKVPIKLYGNKSGIAGMVISVDYDKNLKLKGIIRGDALGSLFFTSAGTYSSPVKLLWDGIEGDTTTGTIAILDFDVPENEGEYSVSVSYKSGSIFDGNLTSLTPEVEAGKITVVKHLSPETNTTIKKDGDSLKCYIKHYSIPEDSVIIVSGYSGGRLMQTRICSDLQGKHEASAVLSDNVDTVKVFVLQSILSIKPLTVNEVFLIK